MTSPRKERAKDGPRGLVYGAPWFADRMAPLAPFIADPHAAKRSGALPLKPPTKDGRP